jgi:surface protein
MWKPIYQPEPWLQYVKRKENVGAPLMEVRKKYLEEQLLFENYVSSIQQLNVLSPSEGVVGGPIPISTNLSSVSYTIDTSTYQQMYSRVGNFGLYQKSIEENGLTGGIDFTWVAVGDFDYLGVTETTPITRFPDLLPTDKVTINWGDGQEETLTLGSSRWSDDTPYTKTPISEAFGFTSYPAVKHSYDTRGEYTITITGESRVLKGLGNFQTWQWINPGDPASQPQYYTGKAALTDITNSILDNKPISLFFQFTMMDFKGIHSVEINESLINFVENLDTSETETISYCFFFGGNLGELDLSGWDTSKVTNMWGTFSAEEFSSALWFINNGSAEGDLDYFKLPLGLSNWDVSSVTSMRQMFTRRWFQDALNSQDISGWDVSNVTDMYQMFYKGFGLNDLDFSEWDVSNNLYFNFLFDQTDFNNTSISSWVIRDNANWFSGLRSKELTDTNAEIILKAWADNPNTGDNVSASFIYNGTFPVGSNMDLAIQTLTAKGWTISGITIA